MPNPYFNHFPTVRYNGTVTRNIILRAKFFQDVLHNFLAFYPYVIKDGQRADMIANDYYGDRELDWLVYFSNDLIDPYYSWPLTQEQFDAVILKKYGTFENAVETIHHYVYNKSVESDDYNRDYMPGYEMSPTTWSFLDPGSKGYWTPVTEYEVQFNNNEKRRNIQLIDNRLKDQVIRELSKVMK